MASAPAVVVALINQETFVLLGGIACGTCAFLWMLKSTGENLMIKSLLARLKSSDTLVDEERQARVKAESALAREAVHVAQLEERTGEFRKPTP